MYSKLPLWLLQEGKQRAAGKHGAEEFERLRAISPAAHVDKVGSALLVILLTLMLVSAACPKHKLPNHMVTMNAQYGSGVTCGSPCTAEGQLPGALKTLRQC